MSDSALRELADDPSSRKRFFKMMGGAGAVSAFSIFLAACGDDDEDEGGTAQTQPETDTGGGAAGDLEIVNYALTLEYLERNFYTAVIDSPLAAELDPMVAELATMIRDNEAEHVDALMATAQMLGEPAPEPETNFQDVIDGGLEMVINTAADVENLGAAAYLGQAGNIQSPEILAAALSIHTVEARHAAALNQLAGRDFSGGGPLEGSVPDGAFAKPMTMEEVLEQVQPFLA